jgi:hypothetical protein
VFGQVIAAVVDPDQATGGDCAHKGHAGGFDFLNATGCAGTIIRFGAPLRVPHKELQAKP